jgi:hypothetical protein
MQAEPDFRSVAQPPLGEQKAFDLQIPVPQPARVVPPLHLVKQAPESLQ